MDKALMIVFTNPASPEQETAFNEWYDGTHLPELRNVPGIVSARRYRVTDGPGPAPDHRYMAIYEMDRPPGEVLADMSTHVTTMSPALDRASTRMTIWQPLAGDDGRG